ncbi:MAG: hypothetical protein AB7F89_00290 [Pirellulaceae bacterium]
MIRRTSARRHDPTRRGQTLLELVAATTILAMTLVPTLRMMRDALRVARDTEQANLAATLAASKLEEQLIQTAANWSTGTVTGDFSADGYAQVRFVVVRSDDGADGGIPGSLMTLSSTVWVDRDGNGAWSAGEPRAVFGTKVAHISAYVYEADGS